MTRCCSTQHVMGPKPPLVVCFKPISTPSNPGLLTSTCHSALSNQSISVLAVMHPRQEVLQVHGWCCHPTTQRILILQSAGPIYPSLPEARVPAPPLFIGHQAILHSIRPPNARALQRCLVWISPFAGNSLREDTAQSRKSHCPPP